MQELKIKGIGKNLILTIDNKETLTKAFETKEDRDNIKTLVATYVKKPTKKAYDTIIKLMSANTVKAKEKKVIEKKIVKKAEKELKSKPKITKEQEQMQRLIEENNQLKQQLIEANAKTKVEAGKVKPIRRSGEH